MEYLSVTAAQKIVLENIATLGSETVPLEKSLGRVLADDIRANRNQPPFDVSAMDGFAVRSADVQGTPTTLQIIEDIKAGDMPTKSLATGQCSRIMTGAPVPQGADAVIPVEDTEALANNSVQINRTVKAGNDIRFLGENMRDGDVVLKAGVEITPGVIGVLATVKRSQVSVYRQPRVAILSTGNELEGLDEPVDANKIPNSNSYALMAQMQSIGIEPTLLGIARDDPEELAQYLRKGLAYDVLLVSGGSSVGVHDFVRPTIEALSVNMHFWRVAMKPGHPLAFGTFPKENGSNANVGAVFGLPGNPVSSMVCVEEFVLPALRRMMNHPRIYRRTLQARLTHDLKKRHDRTEFVRVTLSQDEGYLATSTGPQSSGMLLSMAEADGLMMVAADNKGLAAGALVTVQLLDGTAFQDDAE